jgi:hypothetical protein
MIIVGALQRILISPPTSEVHTGAPDDRMPELTALCEGLRDAGYVERRPTIMVGGPSWRLPGLNRTIDKERRDRLKPFTK